MVDYSGHLIDTFSMTKGLYDAYSKAATEQQNRDAKALDMQKATELRQNTKQMADSIASGTATPNSMLSNLVTMGAMPQAMDFMKLSPDQIKQFQQWQQNQAGLINQGNQGAILPYPNSPYGYRR